MNLSLSVDSQESIVSLSAFFGPDYEKAHGNVFMNIWNNATFKGWAPLVFPKLQTQGTRSLVRIRIIVENRTIRELVEEESLKFIANDVLDLETDCRLSDFYVLPCRSFYNAESNTINVMSQPEPGDEPLTNFMTPSEIRLFRGLGLTLLNTLVASESRLRVMCLEASGGNNAEDMVKLVNYYKRIGFQSVSDDPVFLAHGYNDFNVPMTRHWRP